jgi:hypothetical protein
MVQHDLDHGYVTAGGVAQDYGHAVTADNRVVPAAGSPLSDDPSP